MKRTEIVLQTDLSAQPGQVVMVFRDGGFRLLSDVARAGEVVVVYDLDRSNEADLAEANALFNADFYVHGRDQPYPDEASVIRELIPASGASVLEACCGAGRVAEALVRDGNRVTAVDLSEPCIQQAIAAHGGAVDFRVADVLQLPFPDRSFDVVCVFNNSLGVFFSRRRQMLAELVRVCRWRLLLGLREQPGRPDATDMYDSPRGYLEFSQPHSLESFRPFLDLMPGTVHYRKGEVRPLGGQSWFLSVDFGNRSGEPES